MRVLHILVVCGLIFGARAQSVQQFVLCNDTTAASNSDPPLPVLPDQYEASIEANIVQKNYTTNVREYYDYTNNRLASDHYARHQDGTKVRTVTRLGQDEVYTIYENETCHVRHLNSSSGFYSFVSGPNGTHVRSVKDLMVFGTDYGERYMGEDMVRGIQVDHWQTCLKNVEGQRESRFTLDYYFTKDNYTVDGQQVRVPVRAVLDGEGQDWRNRSAGIHSFYHIYEFFDFHAGPIKNQDVFEIPPGVYCNGSMISKPLPVVHAQFTAGVEQVTEVGDEHTERPVTLYMDQSSNVVRLDVTRPFTPEQVKQFGDKPLVYISDDNTGLLYTMDKWERNCTVIKVTDSEEDVPIFTTAGQFLTIFQQDFVYQGQKIFRGFDVESWANFNTSENVITEILFHEVHFPVEQSTPVAGLGRGPSLPNHLHGETPLQLVGVIIRSLHVGYQPATKTVMHFYGYTPSHPAPEVFDVSSCYSLGHHFVYMALQVEGNYEGDVQFRKHEFVTALQSAIARGAGISVTRVTSILVEQNPFDNTHIVVYFKLLDNQVYGISTDKVGPDLSTAKINLQDAITKGLNFDVQFPTIERNFMVIKETLWETMSSMSMRTDKPSDIQQYSAGAMAGLGIGMLVVGALLGLLVAFVIYKRVDTSVPYRVTQ